MWPCPEQHQWDEHGQFQQFDRQEKPTPEILRKRGVRRAIVRAQVPALRAGARILMVQDSFDWCVTRTESSAV